ncbi:MAG: transglutaminase domain-containing protein [Roseburia sp.]|nr:transglutaminase domain-containing protein [Roseburia sp.]MCM1096537.1 transglutaminase domain-containing protein [Ruminococcus flavefaciens]
MKKCGVLLLTTAYILTSAVLTGCAREASPSAPPAAASSEVDIQPDWTSMAAAVPKTTEGSWDSTPKCLVPSAPGTAQTSNDSAVIDYSNAGQGYVSVKYTGSVSKVKVVILDPDGVKYTYLLRGSGYEVFPLASGDGSYDITVAENISGTKYAVCLHDKIDVTVTDEFGPFLYPNQYVDFDKDSDVVAKGSELAKGADNDLDVVISVYNYMISSITYDYDKASDPPTDYVTDIDAILDSGTGICQDYAAVMAAMLRSQQIPTRLEVGYAKDAYHAWVSVYTQENGWLNGIIQFDGKKWTLVDPTFGANSSEKTLKKFIGDGSNYTLSKVY